MSFNDYAIEGTQKHEILRLHYLGHSPSQIDAELELLMGDAKRTIIGYWEWDKREHQQTHRKRNANQLRTRDELHG